MKMMMKLRLENLMLSIKDSRIEKPRKPKRCLRSLIPIYLAQLRTFIHQIRMKKKSNQNVQLTLKSKKKSAGPFQKILKRVPKRKTKMRIQFLTKTLLLMLKKEKKVLKSLSHQSLHSTSTQNQLCLQCQPGRWKKKKYQISNRQKRSIISSMKIFMLCRMTVILNSTL
jgi:hypothetical protein